MKPKGREVKGLGGAETGDPLEQKVQVHLIYMAVGQPPVAWRPFRGRCQGILAASQNSSSFLCR